MNAVLQGQFPATLAAVFAGEVLPVSHLNVALIVCSSETHPGQLSNIENPDVQPNNGDEVREETNHQPGATWSLRPPDNVVGDYLVIKIPGGDLSAAAPGREADKSVSRLRQQIFKSINCVTVLLSWFSRGVGAAHASKTITVTVHPSDGRRFRSSSASTSAFPGNIWTHTGLNR